MALSRHQTRFELTATDKTKAALKSAEGGFKKLDGVVTRLAAGVAGLVGIGGLALLINRQVEGARQAVAYADALGLSTDALTAMQSAGQAVGIGADKLADILKDTAEKIGDAYRNQGGEAVEVLQSLNLNVAEMARLAPDQQLLRIAGALDQVGTQGEKVQIMEALASDASLLLPLLDDNAAKLRELMQQADATGATLTRIEADKLLQVGEATAAIDRNMKSLGQNLTLALVGPLTDVIQLANRAVLSVGDLGEKFANFVVGDSEVTGVLEDAKEKLKRLEIAHKMARGAAKSAAEARVEEQREIVASLRETEAELEKHRQRWLEGFKPIGEVIGQDSGSPGAPDRLAAEIERLQASLRTQEEQLHQSLMTRTALVNEYYAGKVGLEQEHLSLLFAVNADYESNLTALTEREAQKRARAEQNYTNQINAMRQNATSIGLGLLQTMGQGHKDWAYAGIAIQKALAIQQINVNAANARMAARTLYSLGPAGPAAVAAAEADIARTQAASIALTVAAGMAEAYNVSQNNQPAAVTAVGGLAPFDGGGTITNPAPSTPQGANITIRIVGDGDFKDLVVKSIEAAEANDEIRILTDG